VNPRYAIGIDFGTESARALLVDVATGEEVATSVSVYRNGVITGRLPIEGEIVGLDADWALQDPADYLAAVEATINGVLKEGDVNPGSVIGIGIDFTSCTMLPVMADGTPLCFIPELRRRPHAWPKLWKHHAAQPEADRINEIARRLGEHWLPLKRLCEEAIRRRSPVQLTRAAS
jgi:L-ribulokinase